MRSAREVNELVDPLIDEGRRLRVDAATEQLYDELLARLAAIADIVPSLGATVSPQATHGELTRMASSAVCSLQSGHDPNAAGRLVRMLWPTNTAPHPGHAWWSTPLGKILAQQLSLVRPGPLT